MFVVSTTQLGVIGKAHRLNLTGRAKPESKVSVPRRTRPPGPRGRTSPKPTPALPPRRLPPAAPVGDLAMPVSLNIPLMALTSSMCRWPTSGERAETLFCGHTAFNGFPYCERHAQRSYQTKEQRRREERELRG